jgi:Retrotransposon gag protein
MDTTQMEQLLTKLNERLSILEQENEQLKYQQQLSVPPKTSEPKVALPDKFDGDKRKLRGFLNQLELIFTLNSTKYPTDAIKVAFVGSLLTGRALSWFNPMFEKQASFTNLLNNWANFKKSLMDTFGDPDRTRIAEYHLRDLRQGNKPASSYAAEFRTLATDVEWNQAALLSQFKCGLKPEVKDMLLNHDLPDDLEEFMTLAIKLDNRLFEHQQEKRLTQQNQHGNQHKQQRGNQPTNKQQNHQQSTQYSTTTTTPASNKPVPMEIDAIKKGGKLTDVEKQRRRDQGLCLYCGGNHLRANCPTAPKMKPRTQVNQINIQSQSSSQQENCQGQ